MQGIHIIADLSEIDFSRLEIDAKKLEDFFESSIVAKNLRIVGKNIHTFSHPFEVTGIFALAESHLSFHTWPEFGYVSVDIFVCNLREDNSQKAEKIFEEILDFFDCKQYTVQKIKRGL